MTLCRTALLAGLAAAFLMANPAPIQAQQAETTDQTAAPPPREPGRGPVTNLPLPRYVTLKPGEANARRGPGLSHRIDWVFVRPGMPLRITAEYEHWRRVEDAEGFGGWVHYTRLSGVRSVLIAVDMADIRNRPDPDATVVLKAERNVTARIMECGGGWCRLNIDGEKGWVPTSALWGVEPDEILE